jgi:hypothetical protein
MVSHSPRERVTWSRDDVIIFDQSADMDDVFFPVDVTSDMDRLSLVAAEPDGSGGSSDNGPSRDVTQTNDVDDKGVAVCDQSHRRISRYQYTGSDAIPPPSSETRDREEDVSCSSCSSSSSASTRPTEVINISTSVRNTHSKVENITPSFKQRSSSLDVCHRMKSTRTIRRWDTMMTYQTVSDRDSVTERSLTLERKDSDTSFGFHVIGVGPMIVSTVEPGSPADLGGVLVGDKLISVNDVSVLTESEAAVADLVIKSPTQLKLTVAAGVLSRDIPVHSGYVQQFDDKKMLKNWQRRWAELKHDGFLYLYKKSDDVNPLCAIYVPNHVVVKAPECAGREFVFKLVKYGAKVTSLYLHCLSDDDMIRWVSSINAVIAHKTVRPGMWLDISSHNVGVAALSIKDPECHGYLSKVGYRHRTWHRRYCVLKYACLYYYKDPSSTTAKGVAHLHGYTVEEDITRHKFGFQLIPPTYNMRLFQFTADNETDMKRWMTAMKSSIDKWVAVSQ